MMWILVDNRLFSKMVFLIANLIFVGLAAAQPGCGATLYSSTTLAHDIPTCSGNGLLIGADNMVLDCDGYTISGTGYGIGIYLNGRTNVTIKNCIVKEFRDGIYLHNSSNNTFENNTIRDNFGDTTGIHLEYSDDNTISNSHVFDNDVGVSLLFSDNNLVLNNNVSSNLATGIFLQLSINNTLANNEVNSNGQVGIYLYTSSNNTLTNNTATLHRLRGIYLYHFSNNNTLTNNNASSNSQYGIYLSHSSSNNQITTNWVCSNTVSDFNLISSPGNSGDENTCDNPNAWNDIGTTGCTYSCTAPQIPTPFFPTAAFLGIVLFAPLAAYLAARKP